MHPLYQVPDRVQVVSVLIECEWFSTDSVSGWILISASGQVLNQCEWLGTDNH